MNPSLSWYRGNAALHFLGPGAGLIMLVLLQGCMHMAGEHVSATGDAAVRQVLDLRRQGIDALLSGRIEDEASNWSSTFVANTPDNGVVRGEELRRMFADGSVGYESIQQDIEYAAVHGRDTVVIMGTELVVPGPGMRDAGKRVTRRFTDVFRRESGAWRHDLRHANVISIE